MIFNNTDFADYFKILNIRRPLLPSIYVESTDVTRKDGSLSLTESTFEEMIIEVDIEIKSDSKSDKRDLMREVASKLFSREEKKLIFKSEPGKHYMAKLANSTDLNEFYLYGLTTLIFVASDPIAFGADRNIPFSGTTTLFLGGTYKTRPKFTFNVSSSISQIKITNMLTGKYVEVNHNFISGNVVEIDFKDKWKVRRNGIVIAEYVAIESDFFDLEVGENKINVSANCTLEYIERWL